MHGQRDHIEQCGSNACRDAGAYQRHGPCTHVCLTQAALHSRPCTLCRLTMCPPALCAAQGTATDAHASLNYSIQNYANDVVAALQARRRPSSCLQDANLAYHCAFYAATIGT